MGSWEFNNNPVWTWGDDWIAWEVEKGEKGVLIYIRRKRDLWSLARGSTWWPIKEPNVGLVVDHMKCRSNLARELHFGSQHFWQATIVRSRECSKPYKTLSLSLSFLYLFPSVYFPPFFLLIIWCLGISAFYTLVKFLSTQILKMVWHIVILSFSNICS